EDYGVSLPEDWKELYRYKNGSGFFSMLPCVLGEGEYAFSLLSLEQIRRVKGYFQNRDALLTDFPDYFSKEDIGRMADARLRPYLFHTKWFPFAEYCDSCYLMLDFAPGKAGKEGQILCYVHDPDSVTYAAENITDVVGSIIKDNHIVKRDRQ
ncbi:MAG: SMI1/KNR4 family protein, partial [Dialister invisus]|nr:SMI1/KNR4 family protein [Dialister invisus]